MKIGLVLDGGAHRTIFSCGVLDALLDAGIHADYVIGSSAGITYAISYVSGQKGRNRELFRRYVRDARYAGAWHLLCPWNRSYYNLRFLFDKVPNKLLPFDYAAYAASGTQVLAAVTNLHTGKAEYLPVPPDDTTWQVLRATCALPLLFKPVTLDGAQYADGGIGDASPYEKALADGCDKVIVIRTRERGNLKKPEKLLQFAANLQQRKHPQYAKAIREYHEQCNANAARLDALEAEGIVHVIAPQDTLGVTRTDKRINLLMALYAQGYALTMQQMPALRAYLTETTTRNEAE